MVFSLDIVGRWRMSGSEEEETYSTMFTSLRHPARRKILRMLFEKSRNFTEILEELRISSSHLTYHLESLGELVSKMEDGKYKLSTFGEAAVATMSRVEEAPKTSIRPPLRSMKWKALFATLMVGLILTASLSYVQYQTIGQLSTEYAKIKKEYEQLLDILGSLAPEKAILTYEYTVNGSVGRDVLVRVTPNGETTKVWFSYGLWFIYSFKGNSTLEMEVFFLTPIPPKAYIPMSVSLVRKELWAPQGKVVIRFGDGQGISVTDSGTYSAPLPSAGWYSISAGLGGIMGLVTPTEYAINYTMTLKVKNLEGNYLPFLVGYPFS